ncbi:Glutathione S-transferase PARB-like protein [Drosera capensis]
MSRTELPGFGNHKPVIADEQMQSIRRERTRQGVSMAVRKVYGSLDSPGTLKVMACLLEHDLDFEFVPVDVAAGEHKKKSFLSMSPFGSLPVYDKEGFKLFESRAIIRSMAHEEAKEEVELISWEPKKQAVVANWVDVEDHQFEPPALQLINELIVKPQKGLAPDTEVVAKAETKLAAVLDIYEAQLIKLKFLAADKYTIADLIHLPNLQSLVETPGRKLIESRPHVNAWCNEILARPAWQKVLQMRVAENTEAIK